VELRHLRTLVAIADYGGFAVAGAAIGLTQSAVSLHVKALEEGLGALLFDRSKRPPLLNARGADLVERAREIVRLCADLEDSLAGADIAGVLELGAIPTVLTGTLPAALASMAAAHPGLLVRLTSGLSAELARRVYKGELDAGIVTEPVELAAGLSWHPIAAEPLVVIAPEDAREESDHALLESRPFIRFKRFAWAGQLIDARLRDRGIKVRTSMEVDSLEAISLMVAHGLGVSVVPLRNIPQPFPPHVKVVDFGSPPVQRLVGIIERTSNSKTHFVRALHGMLLGQAGEARDDTSR
jgi:DNA-binding transcriptional LysR family regulator